MSSHKATFANFILRFGEKVLLDYVEEIVLPAFLDTSMVRTYADTTRYHFYNVSLVALDQGEVPAVGIAGRFIKDTLLSRTQIFDPEKGLIHDEHSIASSPSAFFLLILNNHRLAFIPETRHAPDLSAFKATAQRFLKEKHKGYIDSLFEQAKDTETQTTKKELLEAHPNPDLELIPLTSTEGIEKFVANYDVLKSIEFRLVKPNDEIDGAEIFREVRDYFGGMDPKQTKITASNKEGLDKDKAIQIIHDASAAGNQEVTLKGTDPDGNRMTGNNDEFKVAVEVRELPETLRGKARKAYGLFEGLVEDGLIRLDQQTQSALEKINAVMQRLVG
jgi:hypothetical protein